jgi:hypothetical protein
MALIRSFNRKHVERNSLHDEIEATYTTFERDGDREGATALFNILKREFNLS